MGISRGRVFFLCAQFFFSSFLQTNHFSPLSLSTLTSLVYLFIVLFYNASVTQDESILRELVLGVGFICPKQNLGHCHNRSIIEGMCKINDYIIQTTISLKVRMYICIAMTLFYGHSDFDMTLRANADVHCFTCSRQYIFHLERI